MKKFLNKLVIGKKLQLVEQSDYVSNSYYEKSNSNLESAKILFENNKLEEAVSFIYYSMYNLVLSLLFKVGIKSENHSISNYLLKELFGIDNSLIEEAKLERIDKQYYVDFEITKKEVGKSIANAEYFCGNLKSFISELNEVKIKDYRDKFVELIK